MHRSVLLPPRLLLAGIPAAQEPAEDRWFGCRVSGAGDVDGDGHGDFAVGGSSVRVYSGKSGGELLSFDDEENRLFRNVLVSVGDRNGDGAGDLCLSPFDDVTGDGIGELVVGVSTKGGGGAAFPISGRDGHTLRRTNDRHHGAGGLATSVATLGDVDLDGLPDFAAGGGPMTAHPLVEGFVGVYSGASCLAIHRVCRSDLDP